MGYFTEEEASLINIYKDGTTTKREVIMKLERALHHCADPSMIFLINMVINKLIELPDEAYLKEGVLAPCC